MRILSLLLLLAFAAQARGSDVGNRPPPLPRTGSGNGQEVMLLAGGHRIRVEIASTEQSRERGLMQRMSLCRDCGMLFVFEKPEQVSFWMKDTVLPLSIAFIDKEGRILNIEDMEPGTLALHKSAGETLYALEMNQGWFIRNGIRPGGLIQAATARP